MDPGYQDLGRINLDLGNRVSLAFHMKTSIFMKERARKPSQPG